MHMQRQNPSQWTVILVAHEMVNFAIRESIIEE